MKLKPSERVRIEIGRDVAKALAAAYPPGEHHIVATVDVDAVVTVGQPHTRNVVQTACPWTCLAMLLDEFGAERQARLEKVLKIVAALTPQEREDERDDLKEITQEMMERMGFSTEKVLPGQKRVSSLEVKVEVES